MIDTGALFTIMPLDIADEYFIETSLVVDLKPSDGD